MSEQPSYPEMNEEKVLEEYEKLHKKEIDEAFNDPESDHEGHETPDAA